jgi:hypothetical protein
MCSEDQQSKIHQVAHEIRSWGAVAILGAGASLQAGFPLTQQLQALLWYAIETDEDLHRRLAGRFNEPEATAKSLIGSNRIRTKIAFEEMAHAKKARRAYQRGFSRLNSQRVDKYSPTHDGLAQLLHRRIVETVISFNWDTLLETAYCQRYGSKLQVGSPYLYKPHGDAANPTTDWILPHADGYIPDAIINHMQALAADHPRVLLIVGYSERDEEVVSKLVEPLAGRWPVVRISPNATGELAIKLPADKALPALVELICPDPEVPGWEYVTFHKQHDLGSALAGYSLGPADVEACPRLPEVSAVIQALLVTRSAVICGKSGSGKSITAYQAAYHMQKKGWEVLRLVAPEHPTEELIQAVANLSHPTVLIVDDAHTLLPTIPRKLHELTSAQLAVISVSTEDSSNYRGSIPVSGSRAVSTIAEALVERRDEILPVVRQLDDHIGEGYLDAAIEDRIAEAVQSEYPWQFNFVLTGGWRRARDEVASLREAKRADLLLAAIATGQLVSLDMGASLRWLKTASQTMGRDEDWLERSLRRLKLRRLVLEENTVYRCPHLRYAAIVLRIVGKSRQDPEWNNLLQMFRLALFHEMPSLRGISWLLSELRFADGFRSSGFNTIVDDATWALITERCWAADAPHDRSMAAFVLNALCHWHPKQIDVISNHTPLLGRWVEEVNADSAWGLARLLNDIGQEARDLTEAVCNQANPASIAVSLSKATPAQAYSWGNLIGRLSFAASSEWIEELAGHFDSDALISLAATTPPGDLGGLSELTHSIRWLDLPLSLDMVQQAIPTIGQAINTSPATAFAEIRDMLWFTLGYGPGFLRSRNPTREQQKVARALIRALDLTAIANALSNSHRRDWRNYEELLLFLHEAAPRQVKQLLAQVSLVTLDKMTEGLWEEMPPELMELIWALAVGDNYEPARSWVWRHASEITRVTIVIAIVAPQVAIESLKKGFALNLGVESGVNWIHACLALNSIAEVDSAYATLVAETNCLTIAKGFTNLQASDCEYVPTFLKLIEHLAPRVLDEAMANVDLTVAENNWTERLRGKVTERRAVTALLDRVNLPSSHLSPLASRLRLRFPRASIDHGNSKL